MTPSVVLRCSARGDGRKTRIPADIDPTFLTQLVSRQDVVVTARSDTGGLWHSLLLGVVPTLRFMGVFLDTVSLAPKLLGEPISFEHFASR